MNYMPSSRLLLLSLLASTLFGLAPPSYGAQKYDAKISGIMARVAKEQTPEGADSATRAAARAEVVKILVRFSDPKALVQIREAGGSVNSVLGNIASVAIPATALDKLALMDEIEYIEAEKIVPKRLNVSVPATRANQIRTGVSAELTGATGAGVIVGIVDDGLDFRHLTF